MSTNQPSQIMPMIAVPSVDAAREFYVNKLGFGHQMGVLGKDGQLEFCTVVRDGAKIMFTRADGPTPAPSVQIYFQVGDIDGYYSRLSSAGVACTDPENMWWGDRVFIATDNNGYKIWFYETVSEPAIPEGMKVV
ncbi:MAG TPA: VOC family protein [Capsulimonadaceae bacterium]|nr:VOC family protein [Capsulimonadaceae bacterium]